VIAVGGAVIGYLPGYLTEEGYGTGRRFQLLGLAVPGSWAAPAAVVVLGAVALAVLRTAHPDRPWRGALVMTGAALAVTTPELPWYAVLLVALVALDGRAEWLAIAAAGDLTPNGAGYAAAVAAVAVVSLARWWSQRRAGRPGIVPDSLLRRHLCQPTSAWRAAAGKPQVPGARPVPQPAGRPPEVLPVNFARACPGKTPPRCGANHEVRNSRTFSRTMAAGSVAVPLAPPRS
jgi:hypothetical protein